MRTLVGLVAIAIAIGGSVADADRRSDCFTHAEMKSGRFVWAQEGRRPILCRSSSEKTARRCLEISARGQREMLTRAPTPPLGLSTSGQFVTNRTFDLKQGWTGVVEVCPTDKSATCRLVQLVDVRSETPQYIAWDVDHDGDNLVVIRRAMKARTNEVVLERYDLETSARELVHTVILPKGLEAWVPETTARSELRVVVDFDAVYFGDDDTVFRATYRRGDDHRITSEKRPIRGMGPAMLLRPVETIMVSRDATYYYELATSTDEHKIALPSITDGEKPTIVPFQFSEIGVFLIYEAPPRKEKSWDGTLLHIDRSVGKVVGRRSLVCKR